MHYADDAARAAIRVSSRELDDVARAALKRTVARAATRYGDDAFKAVRYGGVELIEAAAKQLVADRLMLEEDIARTLDCAADWGRPRHVTKL